MSEEAKPGVTRWEDLDPRVQERYSGNPREAARVDDEPEWIDADVSITPGGNPTTSKGPTWA